MRKKTYTCKHSNAFTSYAIPNEMADESLKYHQGSWMRFSLYRRMVTSGTRRQMVINVLCPRLRITGMVSLLYYQSTLGKMLSAIRHAYIRCELISVAHPSISPHSFINKFYRVYKDTVSPKTLAAMDWGEPKSCLMLFLNVLSGVCGSLISTTPQDWNPGISEQPSTRRYFCTVSYGCDIIAFCE